MKEMMIFETRFHFRSWLIDNHVNHENIWIRFDKEQQTSTLTAHEALEEALCFGWIDSTIKKIDHIFYIKYFAKRQNKSIWSNKNKGLVENLIKAGLMMPKGFEAIEIAKKNGEWDRENDFEVHFEAQQAIFEKLIIHEKIAYQNYLNMSKSIKKTYTNHYLSAKQESTKKKRLQEIIKRLRNNLKPM